MANPKRKITGEKKNKIIKKDSAKLNQKTKLKVIKTPQKSSRKTNTSKKPSPVKVKKHKWLGKLLHTTRGRKATINDFCQIISVSSTNNSVQCQMVVKTTNGLEHGPNGDGIAMAGNTCYGPVFRLKVSPDPDDGRRKIFVGSYPYITNIEGAKYRKGNFKFSDPNTEHFEDHWWGEGE